MQLRLSTFANTLKLLDGLSGHLIRARGFQGVSLPDVWQRGVSLLRCRGTSTMLRAVLVFGLLGVCGTTQGQKIYAGASADLVLGPQLLAGLHVGAFVTTPLNLRASIFTNFSELYVANVEAHYTVIDDGVWRGYGGGGGVLSARAIYLDGSLEIQARALVTVGVEYRFDTVGVFTELRGMVPAPLFGIAPEVHTGVSYYF